MKKTIAAILLAAMLTTALFGCTVSPAPLSAMVRESSREAIPDEAIFTELLSVPYGTGNDQIGIEPGNECENIGPEDLIVDGSTIIILDSANGAVKFFENGSYSRSIDVSYMGYAMYMAKLNNSLYIVDYCLSDIYELDIETGAVLRKLGYPHGVQEYDVLDLTSDGETVWFWNNEYQMFDLLDLEAPSKKAISIYAHKDLILWSTPYSATASEFKNVYVRFLSYDESGNSYFSVYEPVKDSSILLGETTIQQFSPSGKLIGISGVPSDNTVFHPENTTIVNSDGAIYWLSCEGSGVHIYLNTLGSDYDSYIDEVTEKAISLEKELQSSEARTQHTVTKIRGEVLETAEELSTFSWQVSSQNKTPRLGVSQPAYVTGASSGNTITGMPYAWGRGDSKNNFITNKGTNAPDGMKKMTGNTVEFADGSEITQSYVTGADCSGFVSLCYGFSKIGSYYFSIYYNSISTSSMKKMDYLVKSGVHVVLFHSRNATTARYCIYDSTKNTTGKAACRWSDMANFSSYQARTPWNVVCTYGSYSYSATKHWKTCTNCGYTQYGTHEFELYNSGYRCQKCGFTKPLT